MTDTVLERSGESKYKWYVLALGTLTLMIVMSVQTACMPVLFPEIAEELGLSLVQLGTVWGMIGLGAIFVVLYGGLLGDKFGVKRTLSVMCFAVGLAGASRGLSNNFVSMSATMFLFGLTSAMIPIVGFKPVSIWFSGRQLGLANAVLALGVAIGQAGGSMISATVMSPWLGGWRNVLFLFGAISFIIGIPWLLTRDGPDEAGASGTPAATVPMRQALSHVFRVKNVWLLGIITLGQMGCALGMRGYLPLYLRDVGWTAASADGAMALNGAASMLGVIPITLLSNRLGSRKIILLGTMLVTAIGTALLAASSGPMVWFMVIFTGMVWDGFMASLYSAVMETKGIGATYTGTAMGLVYTFARLGSIVAPIIGNGLAEISPGFAFIFWGALCAVCAGALYFVKEK